MVLQNRLVIHLLHLFQDSSADPKVAVDFYLILLHLALGVLLVAHLVHDLLKAQRDDGAVFGAEEGDYLGVDWGNVECEVAVLEA